MKIERVYVKRVYVKAARGGLTSARHDDIDPWW
jgi:hypothetical protein